MKSIGVVICNYNKEKYVLTCIQAVLESTIRDFDIYVVDNASEDGSAAAIRERYGKDVTVIENKVNLGGSGGFNTGIKLAVEKGYSYVCCLDNDAFLDEQALASMKNFLEEHKDVGMVGAKVYHMDNPDYIQQFGLEIDFHNCQAKTLYADTLDTDDIPEVVYCDTVAACAVMLPAEVIKKVGMMPEDNFIYWDDMEWGYRVKLAGLKVAAIGSARAVHEMGANKRKENTFLEYYMWRNKIHFFMKYTGEQDADRMSIIILRNMFYDIYEAMFKKEYNISQTIIIALKDVMDGIRGKAPEGRIFPNDGNMGEFEEFFQKVNAIRIQGDVQWLESALEALSLPVAIKENSDSAAVKVQVCDSVLEIKDYREDTVYIDYDLNILNNKPDAEMVKNFEFAQGLFLYLNQRIFLDSARRIRLDTVSKEHTQL